jgi:hypothetical protein
MKKHKMQNKFQILNPKQLFLIVFIVALSLTSAFAETIRLKNGQVVEGKVVEKTDSYIKVDIAGVPITYFNDQLEQNEGDKVIAIASPPIDAVAGFEEGRYLNKEQGFSIIWPKGWFKRVEDNRRGVFSISYAKNREPSPGVMDLPIFGITVVSTPAPTSNPLDFANQVFSTWKSTEAKYNVVEPPKEFEVNGIKGAKFLWEKPAWDRIENKEFWVRILMMFFINEGKPANMGLYSRRETYEQDYKNIEPAINSLKFIATSSAGATPNKEGEFYVNKEYGFEIRGPKGWIRHEGDGSPLVVFTKYMAGGKTSFPSLAVTIDMAPEDIRTALAFSNYILPKYQEIKGRKVSGFNLSEPPHEIDINGLKGSRFIFSISDPSGSGIKSLDYKFMRGPFVYSVQGMDYPAEFDKHVKEFEATVNTFKFIAAADGFIELAPLAQTKVDFSPVESSTYQSLRQQILDNMRAQKTFKAQFILKDRTEPSLAKNDYIGMQEQITFLSPASFEVTSFAYYPGGGGDVWRVVGDEIYIKIGVWVPMPTEADSGADEKNKAGFQQMVKIRKEAYKALSFDKYLDVLRENTPMGIAENIQDKYTVINYRVPQAEEIFTREPRAGSFVSEIYLWITSKDKVIRFAKTLVEGKDKDGKEVKEEYYHYFTDYNAAFSLGKPEMTWEEGK